MNKLVIIALIAGGLYWSYQNNLLDRLPGFEPDGPIEDPVFVRMTMEMNVEGREIEGILVGKTRSHSDCEERMERSFRGLMAECPQCRVGEAACLDDIASRELRYFDRKPTHLAYLHGSPSAGEREFAVIFWGLTVQEARLACEMGKQAAAQNYRGELTCIREHDV